MLTKFKEKFICIFNEFVRFHVKIDCLMFVNAFVSV